MLVVHANWTAGAVKLWAESLEQWLRAEPVPENQTAAAGAAGAGTAVLEVAPAHPFAAPAASLRAALVEAGGFDGDGDGAESGGTLTLRLPAARGVPLASDRLVGVVGAGDRVGEPRLEPFTVPALALRAEHAISALLALEDAGAAPQLEFGHSLRYWMSVARLVLELLADQRFIPTLVRGRDGALTATWQPWLHDEAVRLRVGALLTAMPPVVRAVVDAHGGRPWSILDEALRAMTDATVRRALIEEDFAATVEGRDEATDPHVAWLTGLLGPARALSVAADAATEMLRDVAAWIDQLERGGDDAPLRLCLRLNEPEAHLLPGDLEPIGADVRWWLSLHLVGTDGGGTLLDAEQVWRDPAAVQVAAGSAARGAEELLLGELDRAARICPMLESALSEAEPAGVDLSTDEAAAFLAEHVELLRESGVKVIVPGWWGQPSASLGARLQLDTGDLDPAAAGHGTAAAAPSLLGLQSLVRYRWQVAVGDRPLSMEEFRSLARQQATLVRLRGSWVQISPEHVRQAATFFEAEPGGEMTLLEAIQLAYGAEGKRFGLPVLGLDAAGWAADLLGASSGDGAMPVLPQPDRFIGELRPYQVVGLSWLAFLDRFGLGACLADDMGLGKTIQLIAVLLAEREPGADPSAIGPTLLVVPTSVISNWVREIGRFAPSLTVHVQHGPERPLGDRLAEIVREHDVVITTYTLVSRDRETLTRIPWHRVVLDEAQYIKNPPTKQTATIRSLQTTRRVALTGTPVENRLSELWSIMDFCNPGYLGPPGEFRRRFAVPIERHRDQPRADQLRRIVRPFVLRRLKTDPTVIDDLPACVTTREFATLTAEQAALYEKTVNRMLGEVGRAEGIQRRGLVLAALVRLKQICNHPALVEPEMRRATGARRPVLSVDGGDGAGLALLSKRSGKAARLMRMLEEVLATGDKALLFTQFRRMGHLLAAMIQHDLDTEVMFLHGGTPPKNRQQMIDRFQAPDGGVPIFVLSLRAGGIGVNLTAANHVFHFDRWWNPAVENQATDRAFRIGQTRTVHVHKFVCLGTLEERIDEMIEQKTELARNIIGAGEEWLTELSTGQLRELLELRQSAMEADA